MTNITTSVRAYPGLSNAASVALAFSLLVAAFAPLFVFPQIARADSGPNFPSGNSNGISNWGSPNDGRTSDNQCSSTTSEGNHLSLRGFGFSIPSGDTITGILVEVEYAAAGNDSTVTATVQLFKSVTGSTVNTVGTSTNLIRLPTATDCASAEFTPRGGAGDLWGTTWTPAEVNDPDFGVKITSVGNGQRRVDSVRVTVFHGAAPTTATLTLEKVVINDNGGTAVDIDWTLSATGSTTISGVEGDAAVTNAVVDPGTYTLSESGPSGYGLSGWSCSGTGTFSLVGDELTISAGADVTCTATNDDIAPELTVTKVVINDNGGTATTSNFVLEVGNGTATTTVSSGATTTLEAGDYMVVESGPPGYVATFSGDCAADGSITLEIGGSYSCTITNDDVAPGLTVVKVIINDDGGTATTSDFVLFAGDGTATTTMTSGVAEPLPAGTYTVFETGPSGYTASFSGDCDSGGVVTIGLGEAKVCTITNNDIAPLLTITKIVINDNNGTSTVADFDLFVGLTQVDSGDQNPFLAGFYVVSESGPSGYTASFSGDCNASGEITLEVGGIYDCTITNDDDAPTSPPPPPPAPASSGGGGGGGGCAPGFVFNPSTFGCVPVGGEVAGAAIGPGEVLGLEHCPAYLNEYIRFGGQNNPAEVLKLQNFLNVFEGAGLSLTGFYDEATHDAVHALQRKYLAQIMGPWGATRSTGLVFYTTRKFINETHCRFMTLFPLTPEQLAWIEHVRSMGAAWSPAGEGTTPSAPSAPFAPTNVQLPQTPASPTPDIGAAPSAGEVAGKATEAPRSGFWSKFWGWLTGR